MRQPRPGDFGLSIIGGWTGWWVARGQSLTGDPSRYTHAFIVVDGDRVIEAMPGGARLGYLEKLLLGDVIFWSPPGITKEQRRIIVEKAMEMRGTRYSFMDYVALTLAHLGATPKWLRGYITTSKRMICSQLVDFVYCLAGIHLFTDGRLPQDVTPGDLLYVIAHSTQIEITEPEEEED